MVWKEALPFRNSILQRTSAQSPCLRHLETPFDAAREPKLLEAGLEVKVCCTFLKLLHQATGPLNLVTLEIAHAGSMAGSHPRKE